MPSAQGYQKPVNVENLCEAVINPSTQTINNFNEQFKINNYVVSNKDLHLLTKKKSWLNEVLIESYVSLHIQNDNSFIIPNTTSKTILLDGIFEQNGKSYFLKDQIFNFRFVVGPILINNNHWNCFYANCENGDFVYLSI